jgi:hypothetical protein
MELKWPREVILGNELAESLGIVGGLALKVSEKEVIFRIRGCRQSDVLVGISVLHLPSAKTFPVERLSLEHAPFRRVLIRGFQPRSQHLLMCSWVFGNTLQKMDGVERPATVIDELVVKFPFTLLG